MTRRLRPICSLLTALAVLLVSATCSAAGCLLPLRVQRAAAGPKSCCAARHDAPPKPAVPQGDRCALCQDQSLIVKTVEKSRAPDLVPLTHFFGHHSLLVPLLTQNTSLPATSADESPLGGCSTLLALHCALLT